MLDGSIILMGGWNGQENHDVWHLMPAGSSEQNPLHTYTTPGLYQVTLEVTNANGSNTKILNNYITVSAPNGIGKTQPVSNGGSSGNWSAPASAQPVAAPSMAPAAASTVFSTTTIPVTTSAPLPVAVSFIAFVIAALAIVSTQWK
jgi:PKD repeat protein